MHVLLNRQLKRLGLTADAPPSAEQWRALLERVGQSYAEADEDRYTNERALNISSREMRALYDQLRQQSQDELARVNTFLDSVIEELPHPVFVKDAETHKYIRVNRAMETLFGVPRAQLVGHTLSEIIGPEMAQQFEQVGRDAVHAQQRLDYERELVIAGVRKILHTILIPIHDGKNGRFLLGISTDVTERVEAAAALRKQMDLAERASRTKSDFLANMSHEMRTPLNSVVGFARVLLRDNSPATDEQRREYIGYIERAGDHMLTLVNDLLDLRQLEVGGEPLALTAVALPPLVDAALCMAGPMIETRRHTFTLEGSGELPLVKCNQRALIQVLVNLLSNAAKYTHPGGSITLRVSSDENTVDLAIIDDGVGISETDQQQLFTYFSRVGAKHAHHMQGSGVGLALTKALVEKMGGTLTVTSALGVGSTFTVHLARAEDKTQGGSRGHDTGR